MRTYDGGCIERRCNRSSNPGADVVSHDNDVGEMSHFNSSPWDRGDVEHGNGVSGHLDDPVVYPLRKRSR